MTFNHSGGIGDILYSLYFCKDLADVAKIKKFTFHIQTNVKDKDMEIHSHPFGNIRMTPAGAEFLKPLLETQYYIDKVTIDDLMPQDSINLDNFRRLRLNLGSGDIRGWYYNLAGDHLNRQFWKAIIDVKPDHKFKDKILFVKSERYMSPFIDLNKLKEFQKHLVFIGLPKEHELFCKNYFDVDFYAPKNALDAAEKMKGAKGVLGNQTGLYSIAECLKVKRVMIACEMMPFKNMIIPGPHNVIPQGGWCEDVSISEKLVAAVKGMLK